MMDPAPPPPPIPPFLNEGTEFQLPPSEWVNQKN